MSDKHHRARITKRVDFARGSLDDPHRRRRAVSLLAWTVCHSGGRWPGQGRPPAGASPIRSFPPLHENEIEFFFELVPHGATTPPLYKLQVGDEVLMRKVPKGRFTMDTSNPERNHHLLICTVTGVAPFVSYARMSVKRLERGEV